MLRKKLFGDPKETNNNEREAKFNLTPLNLTVDNCAPGEVSKYFPNLTTVGIHRPFEDKILEIQLEMNALLRSKNFVKPPIYYMYNPTEYAYKPYEMYIRKYCTSPKKILFLGMNPGPYGMCQTGVPFGDVNKVVNWLKIEAEVSIPEDICPERPILGFSCKRKEESGERFWTMIENVFKTPENFFKYAFVYNYCPLAFLRSNGTNFTPADMKADLTADKKVLEKICDESYLKLIQLLEPELIIGIGAYAEKKTKTIIKLYSPPLCNITVLRIKHPSRRAVNNQNWVPETEQYFLQNLMQYFQP